MLADPQSITVDTQEKSLPRIGVRGDTNEYMSADGEFTFYVTHRKSGTRDRKTISILQTKIAADPLTAVNQRVNASVALSVNSPLSGFTATELKHIVDALADYVKASTGDNLKKILGGEK